MSRRVRHLLGLSGGKDSSALALYLKDRIPDLEYFFTDTKKELPETYEYIDRLEVFLGKRIVRLNDERGFDHWLTMYGNYLPSSQRRWCTRQLKIKPFEDFVGDDPAILYVAIRADEDRTAYISTKPNLQPRFPFKEDGIVLADVKRILAESGLGQPAYYAWRSRSGCFFCFFQKKIEWVGLLRHHPDLFEKAMRYEKVRTVTGESFTWNDDESLEELAQPERVKEIERQERATRTLRTDVPLADIYENEEDDDDVCLVCRL